MTVSQGVYCANCVRLQAALDQAQTDLERLYADVDMVRIVMDMHPDGDVMAALTHILDEADKRSDAAEKGRRHAMRNEPQQEEDLSRVDSQ